MRLFLRLFLILISVFSLYSKLVSEIPFSHPLSQSNDKLSPDNVNEFFNELESLPHITGSFSPMTGPYAWWQNLFPPKNNDGDFIYVHFKCENKSWDDKWVANVSKDIVKNMREELLSFSPELRLKQFLEKINEKMQSLRDLYKIHLTIKPEYAKWALQYIVSLYGSEDFCKVPPAQFKIFSDFTHQEGERVFPTIVIYAFGYEGAQYIFDRLKYLNSKYPEISAGYHLKHNLGGPVVWWAGGDADYKSGGKLNSWIYGANSKIYQLYGEDEVHFIGQKPLNI